MAVLIDHVIGSSAVVGRDREIEMLDRLLAGARSGRGTTALISGEAGVGKSRLIGEVRRSATSDDAAPGLVLQGNCFEVDRHYPCAPIIDLIQRWRMRSGEHAWPRVVSELERIEFDAGGEHDGQAGKHRILLGLTDFMRDLATGQVLLVIIEDLHWCDEATLELLPYLVQFVREQPILLVLSYRSDEVAESLRRLLTTLDRERIAIELHLNRLNRGEIDALLRAAFRQDRPIRPAFLEMIHTLTDGNPFFIEELLRSLIASGDVYRSDGEWQRKDIHQLRVPRSAHDAVWRRASGVSPRAREVLALAAVVGRHFDFRVIQDLTDMDEESLLGCVRELVGNQLIYEDSADQFAFRHALTRQAIYAELLTRERVRLHRAVAEAIERGNDGSSDQHSADLAYHYDLAGVWEKSFHYAVQAGDRAWAMFSPRAATEHFTRAMRAAEHLSLVTSPELLHKRGIALSTLGRFDDADQDLREMLYRARPGDDRELEWRALTELGKLWAGRDFDRAGSYFDSAYDLAVQMDDPQVVAGSLVQMGYWQVNAERLDHAEELHSRALAIFEELGDRAGVAEVTDLLGIVADLRCDSVLTDHRMARAADLYRSLDDRKGLASVLPTRLLSAGGFNLFGIIACIVGQPGDDDLVSLGEEARGLAKDIQWRSGEAYALICLGFHHGARGDYTLGLEVAGEGLHIAREIEHREWTIGGYVLHGLLYSDLLDFARSKDCLERAASLASEGGSVIWYRQSYGYLAGVRAQRDEVDAAEDMLKEFDSRLPFGSLGQRIVWLGRARLAIAREDDAAALDIVDHLLSTSKNLTDESDLPTLAHLRGVTLKRLQRFEEAERSLWGALTGAETRQLLPVQWRAHASLGDLYTTIGRTRVASDQYGAARAIVNELASRISDDEIRSTFLWQASADMPSTRENAVADALSGLTRREREVARMLADGKANREIAQALFVSERTVETHVRNVLAKLDFDSRTRVATWMIENGLHEDPN